MAKPIKLTHPDGGTITTTATFVDMYLTQGWVKEEKKKEQDQPKKGGKPTSKDKK